MKKDKEEDLFTDEEIENMLFSASSDPIDKLKVQLKEIVHQYPLHTLGLVFALGLLLGVAAAGSNGKK